jgi:vitamin B12 transporter
MSRPTGRLAAVFLAFSSLSTAALAQAEKPDIVVTPSRTAQPIQRAGSAVTVIGPEEIEQSSNRDVGDLLRRVPGLDVTRNGGPGQFQSVRLRGGESRHTLVMIDGIRVNDPSTTGREFDWSTLVLANVERIEVLRGPQSALYGSDAMGGVINIITKKGGNHPPRATLSVEAGSYGTKETKGSISGGDDKVDYAFGFSALDTAGFSGFGYRIPRLRTLAPWGFEPDAARRMGVTGRIGVNVADGVRLEVGGGHSFNRAQYDAAFGPFPDTPSHSESRLSDVYGRLIADSFGGLLRSTVTTFANRTDRRFNDVSYAEGFLFCNNDFFPVSTLTACRTRTQFIGERVGAEYQGEARLGPAGTFVFGARTERDTADSFGEGIAPNPSPRTRTIAAEQTTDSLFGLHQVTVFERLHLSLGGRIDRVREVETFKTWRATAAYEIPETETKLRASIGTGAKAPSLFQLFSPQFGTATLEPEHSIGFDVGIDQTAWDGRLKLSATFFLNRYRNLIDFSSDPADCRPGQFFGCYVNIGHARTTGAELSAEVAVVPQFVRVRATYTELHAIDQETGFHLNRRPEHQGRLALVLTPIPGLTIEPSVVYVGERFDFPREVGKLPPYGRFDLFAEYKINQTFSVYARAENLTNARYEEVMTYGTPGRSAYAGVRATW